MPKPYTYTWGHLFLVGTMPTELISKQCNACVLCSEDIRRSFCPRDILDDFLFGGGVSTTHTCMLAGFSVSSKYVFCFLFSQGWRDPDGRLEFWQNVHGLDYSSMAELPLDEASVEVVGIRDVVTQRCLCQDFNLETVKDEVS